MCSSKKLTARHVKQILSLAAQPEPEQKGALSKLDHEGLARQWFLQLACIRKQSSDLTSVRKTSKRKSQQIRRLEAQLVQKKQRIKDMVDGTQQTSLDIVRTGRRLTWKTSVTLGLRKIMCVVSANSFPLASLIDVSRWTIIRCEIVSWAVLLGRTRSWYKVVMGLIRYGCQNLQKDHRSISFDMVAASGVRDLEDDVEQKSPNESVSVLTQDDAIREDFGLPSGPALLSQLIVNERHTDMNWVGFVGSTFWSGDATNSSIWKRQKLQGIEIRSTLLINRRALGEESYDQAFRITSCMSLDIFLVAIFSDFL